MLDRQNVIKKLEKLQEEKSSEQIAVRMQIMNLQQKESNILNELVELGTTIKTLKELPEGF